MELVITLFPALLALFILSKRHKWQQSTLNWIITYGIYVLLVNTIILLVLKLVFGYGWMPITGNIITVDFALKYLAIGCVSAILVEMVHVFFWNHFEVRLFASEDAKPFVKKRSYVFRILGIVLCALGVLLYTATNWAIETFGNITAEQIVFQLNAPMEGTSSDMYFSFIYYCIPATVIFALVFAVLFLINIKRTVYFTTIFKRRIIKRFRLYRVTRFAKKLMLPFGAVIALAGLTFGIVRLDLFSFAVNSLNSSNFIEENYVDPCSVDITFPSEKRNLIYIYLESMESSLLSAEEGGQNAQTVIPELVQLAKENTNFSDSNLIGGAMQVSGTEWTVAGMTAQTMGLSLKTAVDGNSYSGYGTFLPGAYGLGEILQEAGYNQALMVGSDATFGGRRDLFTTHGNYEIYDLFTARQDGIIPEDYYVWWGYEDFYLYDYAKDIILEMAEESEPFNFTMLTADTHHPAGYVCELCRTQYLEQYSNVYACASRQISRFIEWIQEQDFYENTTIIIAGDHLSMDANYFVDLNNDARRTLNVIINDIPTAEKERTQNREFCTMDWFPTTLAAIGCTIEGDHLGLGTNLYSEEDTLIEQYGIDYVESEMKKKSNFYDDKLLFNKS